MADTLAQDCGKMNFSFADFFIIIKAYITQMIDDFK